MNAPVASTNEPPGRAAEWPTAGILLVGNRRLDIGSLRFIDSPELGRLTRKSAQVLLELCAHAGKTLSRTHLLDTVWRGTMPTPEVVTQAIKELRRALGDDTQVPQYIETVPKLGYRLIASTAFEEHRPSPTLADVVIPVPSIAGPARLPTRASTRPIWPGRMFVAIAVLCTVAGVLAVQAGASWIARKPWIASEIARVTTSPDLESMPTISPDGTQAAYLRADQAQSRVELMLRGLSASRAHPIGDPEQFDDIPQWSPDGREIALIRRTHGDCRIIGIPALGGAARTLGYCERGAMPAFDWTPDGQSLLGNDFIRSGPAATALALQPIGGGPLRIFDYPRAPGDVDRFPRYSPDGSRIAFLRGTAPVSDLYIMDAQAPRILRRLTHLRSSIVGFSWTQDSSALVFSSNHTGVPALFAVDVDSAEPQALGIEPAYLPDMARNSDRGVYVVPDPRLQFHLLPVDGFEPGVPVAASTTNDHDGALSPAADRIAMISTRSGSEQIWVHDLRNGDAFGLTDLPAVNLSTPIWRPDGAAIGFIVDDGHEAAAFEIDIDSRKMRRLSRAGMDARFVAYTSSSRIYLVAVVDGSTGLFGLDEKLNPRLLARDVTFARSTGVDGEFVVNLVGKPGIYRISDADDPGVFIAEQPSMASSMPWDLADSRVFYLSRVFPRRELHAVDIESGRDDVVARIETGIAASRVSLDADGTKALFSVSQDQAADIGSFRLSRGDAPNRPG